MGNAHRRTELIRGADAGRIPTDRATSWQQFADRAAARGDVAAWRAVSGKAVAKPARSTVNWWGRTAYGGGNHGTLTIPSRGAAERIDLADGSAADRILASWWSMRGEAVSGRAVWTGLRKRCCGERGRQGTPQNTRGDRSNGPSKACNTLDELIAYHAAHGKPFGEACTLAAVNAISRREIRTRKQKPPRPQAPRGCDFESQMNSDDLDARTQGHAPHEPSMIVRSVPPVVPSPSRSAPPVPHELSRAVRSVPPTTPSLSMSAGQLEPHC